MVNQWAASIILIVIVAGIALTGLLLYHHAQNNASSYPTQITNTGAMTFTGFCAPCSYDTVSSYSLQQIEQDITMLKGLGVTQIRVDLGFDAWLSNNQATIQKDTAFISFIKSQGLQLVIADASAEQYRQSPLTWTQFKEAWTSRVQTIAELFQPTYYLVIKEPGWYVTMVSDSRTNPLFQSSSDWLNLTSWLASTVLSVSPQTRIGVSVAANSLTTQSKFYDSFLTNFPSAVSLIGFDTYGTVDNSAMQNFLNQYGNQGKIIWNAETWSQPLWNSNEQTDPNWLISQYEFDLQNHISVMMPFYTNDFVSYSTSTPTNFVLSTPVGFEFEKIISVS